MNTAGTVAIRRPAHVADPTWRRRAACKGRPLEWWFVERGTSGRPLKGAPRLDTAYNRARIICGRCPVRLACLDMVMEIEPRGQRYGLYAGLSPAERANPDTVAALRHELENRIT